MDDNSAPCAICGNDAECGLDWAIRAFTCPRCGTYEYDSTVGWIQPRTPDQITKLSGWVRDQNDAGIDCPRITPEIFRQVEILGLPGLRERAIRGLAVAAKQLPDISGWYGSTDLYSPEFLGRTFSFDENQAQIILQLMIYEDWLRENRGAIGISIRGLLELEAGNAKKAGLQGFVAMSFDKSLDTAWSEGFYPAIRSAGFAPMRIDAKEYVGGISDEIISEIRRSRFVVADYTGQKNGVYFEAGFALGLGLIVIPTCKADDVNNLHFDIKHLNTLLWSDANDLAEKLSRRIAAVVGG